MSLLSHLVALRESAVSILTGHRELSLQVAELLVLQRAQMEAFDDLKLKFDTQTAAIVKVAEAQVSLAESQGTIGTGLANLTGDVARLQEIIAGAGGVLNAEQTAEVSALVDKANAVLVPAAESLTTNAAAMAASARDLATLAAVVPETA